MDCEQDPAAYLFGSSIIDCPAIMSTNNITVRSESSSSYSINEDKLKAIDIFIEAFEKELKAKKVNLGLSIPVKNQLMQAALTESRLEGQVHEIRLENKRLNQRIEMAQVQIARQDMDSGDALRTERLEGQVDIHRDENNKLSVQVESLKLDLFQLTLENTKLKEEANKQEKENNEDMGQKAKLEAEIRIIKEENELLKNNRGLTYAMAASVPTTQKPPTAVETRIARAKEKQANVLFFKSTEKKSSKEVKEAITRSVNPREDKVKIKAIRPTSNTVIVETATKEDATKITQKTASLQNIICEENKKRRPMVIIYQVPTSLQDNEFLDNLYEMNLSDTISKEDFQNEVSLKFKTGCKSSNKANYVLEVSPRIWSTFLRTERLYMDFESLKVKDFARVARCYKCHDLGHSSTKCKLEVAVCYRCAKPDHIKANCKEAAIGCIPCYYRKRPCDHAGGADCPTHKQLMDKLLNNTDYGQ